MLSARRGSPDPAEEMTYGLLFGTLKWSSALGAGLPTPPRKVDFRRNPAIGHSSRFSAAVSKYLKALR
jgi:hypothetical protein